MGSLAARDMAAHADLETSMHWHILYNHYPPPPAYMVAPCVKAVQRIRNGTEHIRIRLPSGVRTRDGRHLVNAHELAEAFHLYDFT